MCVALLGEDLLQCVAALKHPHVPLLLQDHLQPLVTVQHLLRQGLLQLLRHKADEKHLEDSTAKIKALADSLEIPLICRNTAAM